MHEAERPQVYGPEDIASLYGPFMRDLKNEIFAQVCSELGCAPEELELKEQTVRDRDNPQKGIPLAAVAMSSYFFQGGPPVGKSSYFASFPPFAPEHPPRARAPPPTLALRYP